MFLNYSNFNVSISSSRNVNSIAADVDDIIKAVREGREEELTASIEIWAKKELNEIDISFIDDREELESYIFNVTDFMQKLEEVGIDLSEYPELRDYQNDFIDNNSN